MNGLNMIKEYRKLTSREHRLRARIDTLTNERDKITNDITKERVQSSRIGDKVQQLAIEIADAKAELSDLLCEKTEMAQRLWRRFDEIPDDETSIIIEEYVIGGKGISRIAEERHYSDVTIYRRIKKAIDYMQIESEC